jgi:transposase
MIFSGTLNKELLSEWILTQLAPNWNPEDVLIWDNSSIHKSKLVKETLAACGIAFLCLPRYSPDFNPIELLWTKVKSVLKKEKARTEEKLESALNNAMNDVPKSFVENWYSHCRYSL